ncbi:family 20 glycosylhydrolase [Abyssalbus ytuae]|uniref:beta-N-acetylhexosaminidase n=1 Tax=Abyssalbus ytuae TaxID=2926907 RepID=A0A9E6ZLH7_9FLAO|nr:family 20 glycosylhydrolase [Abyssalbus ytuae]UOB16804.1 family 20 glycosylhydrolase [Abyssalbus ytuae]
MKLKIVLIIFILMSCKKHDTSSTKPEISQINVLPKPQNIEIGEGYFYFNNQTSFVVKDESAQKILDFFSEKIKITSGYTLKPATTNNHDNIIELITDNNLSFGEEEYNLSVTSHKITIKAKTGQGLFYGMQTLFQVIPLYSSAFTKDNTYKIPAVTIQDAPQLKWRGFHLDVSRHFFSTGFIKKQLDILSIFKINKFHWHLTDDQGWRIEIKKYPELVSTGSVRKENDGSLYKGHYTQEEIKEVVNYAKERYIDVIPEFDVPGHVMAVLAAYPELSCESRKYEVRNLWGVESAILCPGKETTYEFIDNVVKELSQLFPYQYFHMGGDEVPKVQWENSAQCQNLKNKKGLKNNEELQGYFMKRVEKILAKYNKKMIGWDEVMDGGVTRATTIMSWQGEEAGIKAANNGHDVIMTPSKYVYLNFYQGDYKAEPLAFGGYITLKDAYTYNPVPHTIKEENRKHILGLQGNMWSEYTYKGKTIEYLLYPRILALAETGWTKTQNKNFNDFLNRLTHIYPILDKYNVNYHIPLPEGPTANRIVFTDSVKVSFTTTRPVKMVYTTDGTTPAATAKVYKDTLIFHKDTNLKIASVLETGKMSKVRNIQLVKESYLNPVETPQLQNGLKMRTLKGYYKNIADVDTIRSVKTSYIKKIEDVNTAYHWGHEVNTENFKAVFLDGYIKIPQDGIYYFSSTVDKLWIGNKLIINYKDTLKKHPKENSVALKKGIHKLKIIYLNNLGKGWATDWNPVEIKYRKSTEKEYKLVNEHMIFINKDH